MTLNKSRCIWMAVAIALGVVLQVGVSPREPVYHGMPAGSWFNRISEDDTPSAEETRRAFRSLGAAVVPYLCSRLDHRPSMTLADWIANVEKPLGAFYLQRLESGQIHAAYMLGEMGAVAVSAESRLMKLTNSPNWSLRGAAIVALQKIHQNPP